MAKKKPDIKETGVNTTVEDLAPSKPVRGASEVQKAGPDGKKPERKLDPVRVEVFARTRMKPDQAAGFLHYAKKGKMVNRTIPEWQKAFDEFQKRLV